MHHEPSGFVGDAKLAVDFVGAASVLALIEQVRGHPPFSQGHFGAFKDSANGHSELAFALNAVVQAGTSGFARQLGDLLLV
jgi:hypothetical protein